jgi:nucleotidyltransferase AbiEii toxin of type IV toxin-antitoxin system
MADKFFDLSAKEQRDVLEVARTAGGRPVHLLEKDVWVVWTLATMFGAPFGAHLVFKGGTSLSKAYKAIRRFSEDVDLTYDIHQLIPDLPPSHGDFIPPNRSQAKKLSDIVRNKLPLWVSEHALSEINRTLKNDRLTATARAEGEKIFIEYEALAQGYGFVKPVVMLEFGGRSSGEPSEIHEVVCDAAEFIPIVRFPEASARVMRVERTFWEKATAAHVFCRQGRLGGEGFARHWYDLACLHEAGYAERALADREVARAVAIHKRAFFPEKDAQGRAIDYRAAVSGALQLVPEGTALETLRLDYSKIVQDGALLDDNQTFDALIDRCRTIEIRANELS